MSRQDEVREDLKRLIGEILARKRSPHKPQDIADSTSLMRDLGIDSLDVLQLAAVVEKKYGIRFSEQETRGLDEFGTLASAVLRRLDAGG